MSDPEDQTDAFETRAIHAGQEPDPTTGAVMPPIHTSSTFAQDAPGEDRGYEYARTQNPTRETLEANLASLEGAAYGRAYASGMAAITSVVHLLEPGDHVVVGRDVYGGTYRLFEDVYADFDLSFQFVDATDPGTVQEAIREDTQLVWIETPTNPLLQVVDIQRIAAIAGDHDVLCAVDNTFATPYLQRPLALGADIVAHSLTKYLGGHSDLVAGALLVDDPDLDERLGFHQNSAGAVPDPVACYQVLRGTKTLPVRMDRHCENARSISNWLADHTAVERVFYPGLSDHPGHAIAREQMEDFGGMVSFELEGSLEAARTLVSSTSVFTLAESLGGVESLIEQPATMTHASVPRAEREQTGVTDGLIRLSVGLEDRDDLINDLDQAISTAVTSQ